MSPCVQWLGAMRPQVLLVGDLMEDGMNETHFALQPAWHVSQACLAGTMGHYKALLDLHDCLLQQRRKTQGGIGGAPRPQGEGGSRGVPAKGVSRVDAGRRGGTPGGQSPAGLRRTMGCRGVCFCTSRGS